MVYIGRIISNITIILGTDMETVLMMFQRLLDWMV